MTGSRVLLAIALWLAMTAVTLATAPSGDYYNQGNAHARAGEWGLAMLDYQRARLQRPDDADLEVNRRYVLSMAKGNLLPSTFVERISQTTTPDIAAILGLAGLVALGSALLWRNRGLRTLLLLFGIPLTAFGVCHAMALRPIVNSAVVIRGPAAAQASPVPMADELFSLPEAEVVHIEAVRPDYLLVTDRRGKVGWVSRSHVEPVVPEG